MRRMSSSFARYLSIARMPPVLASRTWKCMRCTSASAISTTTWTISAPSTSLGRRPGTRWTPSITIDQPSVGETLQLRHRALALLVAEALAGEAAQPLEVDGPLAPLGEVDLDPARELVRAVGGNTRRDQRTRHQPLRVRQVSVAERQRLAVA